MPQDEPIEGDTDANNDWEDGCRWWISAHQRIAQMPLVDLCAPADLHYLFLLDVGDSSSLLRDPVPAHLAAPPRRALRGGGEDRAEVRRTREGRCSSSSSRWRPCRARRRDVFFQKSCPVDAVATTGAEKGWGGGGDGRRQARRRCGGPRRPLREVRPPSSPAATTQDPAPRGLLPAGSHGILLPAGFADMARGETTVRAAGVGIVESVGARDPSCSSTGEDEPYNGPPAVSSAWENGTEASPREATRRPSAGQSGG